MTFSMKYRKTIVSAACGLVLSLAFVAVSVSAQMTTGGVPVSISFNQAGGPHQGGVTAGGGIDVYLTFPDQKSWQPGSFGVEYTVVGGGTAPVWKDALKNPPTSLYSTDKGSCYFRLFTTRQKTKNYQVQIRVTRSGYKTQRVGTLLIQHAP